MRKKLLKWWLILANGGFTIIYQDNKYKNLKFNNKIDVNKLLDKYYQDENVKAIIWSAMSSDVLVYFIDYLIKKFSKNKLNKLLELKDLPSYLIENYKLFFVKYKLFTKKDFTFKS